MLRILISFYIVFPGSFSCLLKHFSRSKEKHKTQPKTKPTKQNDHTSKIVFGHKNNGFEGITVTSSAPGQKGSDELRMGPCRARAGEAGGKDNRVNGC